MDFKIENLPYLYHSEYSNDAWGGEFAGFFIDANGVKYKYKNPDNWKNYNEHKATELNVLRSVEALKTEERMVFYIKPDDLFHNLSICKVKKPWFGVKPKHLWQEIIDELLKSELIDYGLQMHDAGTTTNSLFVYDKANDHYKQVILSVYGNYKRLNSSAYAQQLIAQFGEYRHRR